MLKNILIISHKFPPAPGIGGRRWAKFAKYLSRLGNNIFILTAENVYPGKSEWCDDVKGLQIESMVYNFPKILSIPVKTIFDKINYKFAVLKVKILDKGNYYDKTIFWEKQIQERVSYYIQNKGVKTVIVTGAPFRLIYQVTALKKQFKDIIFISDFRDLWTEDLEISAFSKLSRPRIEVEKKYEKEAIINSDFVFTVSKSMKDYFSGLTSKNNCVVIPNGYDPDDLSKITVSHFDSNDPPAKAQFIFAGTLYNNLNYILIPFFKAVKQLKEKRPELYAKFNLEFYGKFPVEYKKYVEENNITDSISIRGEQPYSLVSLKIRSAHFGVLFLNDLYNFSFSTKFCEYVGQKKKIVVVSNIGETAEFVTKNGLGFHIDSENPFNGLVKCMEFALKNELRIELNEHFEEGIFSIENISKELEKYL